MNRSILITGASSGIGAAVAREYARRGAEWLFLCGRNRERLDAVAADCRASGAKVSVAQLDVSDGRAVSSWIAACEALAPLDAVFANAGQGTGRESSENVRATFAINLMGVVNTVLPAIEVFRSRKALGQIVLTASIAGYAPLPGCPSYAGTKAGVKNWGLSLRGFLRREGIKVNVVCPGFVRSRITDRNTCPMPFFMEAEKAAKIIVDRVERNVGLIAFPWPMRLATWFLSMLPWRLSEFVGSLLPEKRMESASAQRPNAHDW